MYESDDEEPQLSSSTLAALQEFLCKERFEQQNLLELVSEEGQIPSNILFDENWVSYNIYNNILDSLKKLTYN